jgi:nicotinate-nucleotide adenylyltransferase
MKVGLFFGSFNPIHIGHLIIANVMAEETDLEKVWFVVSPQNPFKSIKGLLHEFDRFDMVRTAVYDNYKLEATDVEFNMPKPSYTVDTLAYLSSAHPDKEFKLIIGEDNLHAFPKWKNYRTILEEYGLYVYPRPGSRENNLIPHPNIVITEAPLLDISATYIRRSVKAGKSIKYLVHPAVEEMIISRKWYI